MKKIFIAAFLLVSGFLFAQSLNTVPLNDEVYNILLTAEMRGSCTRLINMRPFTRKYIIERLDEIIENEGADSRSGKIAEYQKNRFKNPEDGKDLKHLAWRYSNKKEDFPISFLFHDDMEAFVSGGIYSDKKESSNAQYEFWNRFNFRGDLSKYVSWNATGYLGVMKTPLKEMGTSKIGAWWRDEDLSDSARWNRQITAFRNTSVFPNSYKKPWSGTIFYFSHVDNSGQQSWPFENSFAYGMTGEITSVFAKDHVNIFMGRYDREFCAMDKDSSLVLNSQSQPFFGFDINFYLFKWLSFTTCTGTLEAPNQEHINKKAYGGSDDSDRNDSYYYQNMFASATLNLDWKYVHFDFGSSVVYPKRSELGYVFPIIDRVISQDNFGDYDNLSLHTDIKFKVPNITQFWFSFYLDEQSSLKLNKEIFEKTRNMFAYQAGIKFNMPDKFLPYCTLSFRYTKIEPYCYTHQVINNHPQYSHYVSTAYTNNGYSLGYYLPPNSDEFLLRMESRPSQYSSLSFTASLSRHGADFGSQYVPGSSLYSEMSPKNRDSLNKYFLNDGAYEWTLGLGISGTYDLRKHKIPVQLSGGIGFVGTWWSLVDDYDNASGQGSKHSHHFAETDEYKNRLGVVISLGIKAFSY